MKTPPLHPAWRGARRAFVIIGLAAGPFARMPMAEAADAAASGPPAAAATPAQAAKASQDSPSSSSLEPIRFVSRRSGRFGGRDVQYVATAGETFLRDGKGEVQASIFTFAYVEEGADPASRPVTFLWNGGPGSSSVWLHMGAFGPVRIALPSDARSAGPPPYRIEPNTETILDVSDLVFVDPVGTGFSRALGDRKDEQYWNLNEDIASMVSFITTWLTENKRWNSPRYIAGESYGTTRAAAVAERLQNDGVDINGLVLASQALDFTGSTPKSENLTSYITYLPTMAVTAWYHNRVPKHAGGLDAFLKEARRFATDEYAPALLKGSALDPKERARVAERLAYFTGLDRAYIERADLRPLMGRFLKELLRSQGLALGWMDARYTVDEVDDVADEPEGDATSAAITSPFDTALRHYIAGDLGVSMTFAYRPRSQEILNKWNWRTVPEGEFYEPSYVSVGAKLGRAMRRNPGLRVLVASGYYDCLTPFFDAELTFARHGIVPERVKIIHYESGHMLYVHDPSRRQFLEDVRAFIKGG